MISKEMQRCIQTCQECHAICTETVLHCLTLGGEHAEAHHVRLLLACAAICRTSATFLELGSDLHTETCRVCATAAPRTASACRATRPCAAARTPAGAARRPAASWRAGAEKRTARTT
jgi:hypothetical protein